MERSIRTDGDRAATSVIIVDADRRVLQSVAEILRLAGLNVVGTAGDVRSALEVISELEPAVLVVDPQLPDAEAGASLLSSVSLGWPLTRVVVMGWTDNGAGSLPGADAFVSKSAEPEAFVSATIDACRC